ncbi:hypothetical protein SAMN04488008_104225 [Maribacter orientalis]|uniref:Uncharacterized protein n=1 Tax=Maribacter orientalis TaxID=228957 RepID=A0A1H7RA45_9FLAO|nr:hypothetical protein SAMN04488008_104225 [Maribacter orientalis]
MKFYIDLLVYKVESAYLFHRITFYEFKSYLYPIFNAIFLSK